MANQPVQTVNTSGDKVKVGLAICAAVVGVVGFYLLAGQSTLVRSLALVAGLVVAIGLLWTSLSGQGFLAFAKEAIRETKKVVWPTRKEAMQMTAYVFGFVVIMALFLWLTDKTLEWVFYDLLLGWKK